MTPSPIINSKDTNKIIPAVVVSVIGALLKKRQKKAFQLVQEDPRNFLGNKTGSNLLRTEEPSTSGEPVLGISDYIEDDDGNAKYGKLYEDNMMNFANQNTIKPSECNYIKPIENNLVKPSGNS
ncbi:unnamed protein product [Cunninghamella blakesleeana]